MQSEKIVQCQYKMLGNNSKLTDSNEVYCRVSRFQSCNVTCNIFVYNCTSNFFFFVIILYVSIVLFCVNYPNKSFSACGSISCIYWFKGSSQSVVFCSSLTRCALSCSRCHYCSLHFLSCTLETPNCQTR